MDPALLPVAVVAAAAVAMAAVERLRPAEDWPDVEGWGLRAAMLNAAQVAVVLLGGRLWDRWFAEHSFFRMDAGPWAGAALGYVLMTFVFYWWHRWRHRSDLLWRWCHQVHHSVSRLEVVASFYKHPLEIAANGALTSFLLFAVLGLDAGAAGWATALSGLSELFYHWNVSTPRWLGLFIQRPESHRLHHQLGVHRFNYGDLPVWDMLFGTYRNPVRWSGSCGFGEAAERRLPEMLAGTEVA